MGVQIDGSTGNIIATKAEYSGNVSIAGTLTYEDVTNVDSVGLITARNGISVSSGDIKVGSAVTISQDNIFTTGIVTATSFSGNITGATTGIVTTLTATTATVTTGIVTTLTATTANATSSIGIATATPRTALDAAEKTDAIALPSGTTAQRPSGTLPYLRKNTTNNALEYYDGSAWVEIITDYFPTGSAILG
jgi:hypothetical protein|tara:strand:- start:2607 stop:3185 length:579 start_codon:yes stop_codon:yes gene_type:complete